MNKFIPTAEQLQQIKTRYEETRNYSLVSRETGISVSVIKRILSEPTVFTTSTPNCLFYDGMTPDELRERPWDDYNIEAQELHKKMVERNGIL